MSENVKDCLVSVVCSTYNQKKYLTCCLDSLLMQKTDFPYEIIVKDDASTDGQQEIIREYAEKYPGTVRPLLFEQNYGQRGLADAGWEIALKMCRGKYVAICEGDDFWTDAEKLQLQADFMESHPDFALCGHAAYYANEDGTLRTDRYFQFAEETQEIPTEKVLSSWTMSTNSILYRVSCRPELTVPYRQKCPSGDFALITYLALHGRVYYMSRRMSAYRINSSTSVTRSFLQDMELYRKRRMEFFLMLDRLDEYTEGKYSDAIRGYRDEGLFDYYLTLGDGKQLKQYRHVLPRKGGRSKAMYLLCVYCNPVYKAVRKIHTKYRLKGH